jgi:hypothetical protein
LDHDPDNHVPLKFDVIPGAEKVARLPIERVLRLCLDGGAAQHKKQKRNDYSHTALYAYCGYGGSIEASSKFLV